MSGDGSDQNAAIPGRLRELYNRQIEQFRTYIAALEKQQAAIEAGIGEKVLAYVEIEEGIAAGIISVQNVIDPLESVYNEAGAEIAELKTALEGLKSRAASQAERNRDLISARLADIGADIAALRNNPLAAAARRSLYHNAAPLIDIEG